MKFEKFVKSLASSGVIYNQPISDLPICDRWLASPSVFMRIPVTVKSVTAAAIQEMPKAISKMIDQIGHTEYAELAEAIMPFPMAVLKIAFGSSRPRTALCPSRSVMMTGL